MVNESKDPSLCHVCDLAPCWSVKSCSYSVVFGFIRISKHKPGNSLQCVFLSFSDWLSCNIQKNNHFLAGNVFNKKKRKKKSSIQWCKFVPDGLSLVRMCTWTCSCLAPFFTACSHHKNLKSSCGVPTSSTSTHIQTHWRTFFKFFFHSSRRRERLARPERQAVRAPFGALTSQKREHWYFHH